MGVTIKVFSDGSKAEYDKGKIDNWCVYLVTTGKRCAPRDSEYFTILKGLADKYGTEKVYADFVTIYDHTNKDDVSDDQKSVVQDALTEITGIANSYTEDALAVDQVFTILYMAMVAEEKKAGTRLGKRIKRLGVHMMLFEGLSPKDAAGCLTGKRWQEIDAMCNARKF